MNNTYFYYPEVPLEYMPVIVDPEVVAGKKHIITRYGHKLSEQQNNEMDLENCESDTI